MRCPTPIVFLDIDGVMLNRARFAPGLPGGENRKPSPAAVEALNRIYSETGAAIVVSSVWRIAGLMAMRELLAKWGAKAPVIGITPRLIDEISVPRGREIRVWLDLNEGRWYSYLILDDDADMESLVPRFIQTRFDDGLTMVHVDRAIQVLRDCEFCHGSGTAISSNAAGDEQARACCCPSGDAKAVRP